MQMISQDTIENVTIATEKQDPIYAAKQPENSDKTRSGIFPGMHLLGLYMYPRSRIQQ